MVVRLCNQTKKLNSFGNWNPQCSTPHSETSPTNNTTKCQQKPRLSSTSTVSERHTPKPPSDFSKTTAILLATRSPSAQKETIAESEDPIASTPSNKKWKPSKEYLLCYIDIGRLGCQNNITIIGNTKAQPPQVEEEQEDYERFQPQQSQNSQHIITNFTATIINICAQK